MKRYIVDTTLRDGEQTPGVAFSRMQKMEIAVYLDQLGIEEVEVGTPAMGVHEQNIIREIATAGFSFKTISWCRALKLDIDLAEQCKTNAVNISFPVSDIQLKALNRTEDWVIEQIPELVKYAASKFKYVYVGMQDASRSNRDFLLKAIATALSSGASRIRIADTVGIMNPVSVTEMFSDLLNVFPDTDFELHAHNDLGMATANAYAAHAAGCAGISGTINGIGERAGNVAIEELIMAEYVSNRGYALNMAEKNVSNSRLAKYAKPQFADANEDFADERNEEVDELLQADKNSTQYNTQLINKVCHFVAEAACLPLHQCKPVVGKHAFVHETGVHVKSVLKNKMSYQPYDESKVGAVESKIVIGKHSGRAAIEHFFLKKGKELTSRQVTAIHKSISDNISSKGEIPSETYLMNLYNNVAVAKRQYSA